MMGKNCFLMSWPKIVSDFKGKLVINWAGTTWMNDENTEDYLHKIIGCGIFASKRLLVWDAFASHKSERTKKILKQLNIEAAYIPGVARNLFRFFENM